MVEATQSPTAPVNPTTSEQRQQANDQLLLQAALGAVLTQQAVKAAKENMEPIGSGIDS